MDAIPTTRWLRVAVAALVPGSLLFGQGGLSDAGRAFARSLESADWAPKAAAAGVEFSVRAAPLVSAGMVNAVANRKSLTREQRELLRDVMRVVFSKDGWFFDVPVEKGSYSIGVEGAGGEHEWVLRDEKGQRRGASTFWIRGPHDQLARGVAKESHGAAVLTLRAGEDEMSWRYVARRSLRRHVATLRSVRSGSVTVHTDLPRCAAIRELAELGDNAVSIHAKLLQRERPTRDIDLYVLTRDRAYEAIGNLLCDGEFNDRQGFHSSLTQLAFVHYTPLWNRDQLERVAFRIAATVIHELHHLVASELYPDSTHRWPVWLKEGLAELGTVQALGDRGAENHDRIVGNWIQAKLCRTAPALEDLMTDAVGDSVTGFYAAAYLFVRDLSARPKALRELLDALTNNRYQPMRRALARDLVERRWGSAAEIHARSFGVNGQYPAIVQGHAQRRGRGMRLLASPDGPARAVYPTLYGGSSIEVRTSFRFEPVGQMQADVYLAYSEGARARQFLKVAVGRDYIMLFWYHDGTWHTIDRVQLEGRLATREWHELRVDYDASARRVEVATTGGRKARFQCEYTVPLARTRVGIGCYNSIVDFESVVVRPKK